MQDPESPSAPPPPVPLMPAPAGRPAASWRPAVEGRDRLGEGQPDAARRKPRPNFVLSVAGSDVPDPQG